PLSLHDALPISSTVFGRRSRHARITVPLDEGASDVIGRWSAVGRHLGCCSTPSRRVASCRSPGRLPPTTRRQLACQRHTYDTGERGAPSGQAAPFVPHGRPRRPSPSPSL